MTDIDVARSTATAPTPTTAWLLERIAFYGQIDPATLSPDTPLTELGLDSVYSLTLCGDIEDAFGLPMDVTYLAEYATLRELGDGVDERLAR